MHPKSEDLPRHRMLWNALLAAFLEKPSWIGLASQICRLAVQKAFCSGRILIGFHFHGCDLSPFRCIGDKPGKIVETCTKPLNRWRQVDEVSRLQTSDAVVR